MRLAVKTFMNLYFCIAVLTACMSSQQTQLPPSKKMPQPATVGIMKGGVLGDMLGTATSQLKRVFLSDDALFVKMPVNNHKKDNTADRNYDGHKQKDNSWERRLLWNLQD